MKFPLARHKMCSFWFCKNWRQILSFSFWRRCFWSFISPWLLNPFKQFIPFTRRLTDDLLIFWSTLTSFYIPSYDDPISVLLSSRTFYNPSYEPFYASFFQIQIFCIQTIITLFSLVEMIFLNLPVLIQCCLRFHCHKSLIWTSLDLCFISLGSQ